MYEICMYERQHETTKASHTPNVRTYQPAALAATATATERVK